MERQNERPNIGLQCLCMVAMIGFILIICNPSIFHAMPASGAQVLAQMLRDKGRIDLVELRHLGYHITNIDGYYCVVPVSSPRPIHMFPHNDAIIPREMVVQVMDAQNH